MKFRRDLYRDEGQGIAPHLDTIERVYDLLSLLPQRDEANFITEEQHRDAANHAGPARASAYLFLDAYNWLKLFWYTNLHKSIRLMDGLFDAYNPQNYLIWPILARSALEYSAVLYYFTNKIDALDLSGPTFAASHLRAFEELIMAYTYGSRFPWDALLAGDIETVARLEPGPGPKAVNVLTALGHLAKRDARFVHIQTSYAMLSDFAHPNMASHATVLPSSICPRPRPTRMTGTSAGYQSHPIASGASSSCFSRCPR